MLESFNFCLYLRICKERRRRGLSVDLECEKLAKECIDYPGLYGVNYDKLIRYCKEKNLKTK